MTRMTGWRGLLLIGITCQAAEPLLVAHRGASHDAPENTLPAFELAWEQGADAIEGDFWLSADGKIVCIHDADTKRTAGVKKVVKETPLDELRELEVGGWFGESFKGTPIPEFHEVAATVPDGGLFYIEIKCGPEIVPTLLSELKRSDLKTRQIVVISFNAPVIKELKRAAPHLKACWLSSFDRGGALDPSAGAVLETLRETGADGFSSKADKRIGPDFVKQIRDAGYEYHCWTVDVPETAKRFLGMGTMSVTTNRPGWLREQLARE